MDANTGIIVVLATGVALLLQRVSSTRRGCSEVK
jgi:hypothetical protein